jgi:hypothetical protein
MQNQEIDFYKIILPYLVGLVGVLIGSIITAISGFSLKKREVQLRLVEKIFDRRISAHEDILELIKMLKSTISTGKIDENSNFLTYPGILLDKEVFDGILTVFWNKVNRNSHWFSTTLLRELHFVQDYLYNLDIVLKEKNESFYPKIASIIKSDILDLANNLEKLVMQFFDKEIYVLDFKSNKKWHKYKRDETERRLCDTQLIKQYEKINNIDKT